MPKKIIRVENINGIGPFANNIIIPYDSHLYENIHLYPAILNDYNKDILKQLNPIEVRSACPNICQFFNWFGIYIKDILKYSNVYIIEVEDYILSNSKIQCLYNPKHIISKQLIFKNHTTK